MIRELSGDIKEAARKNGADLEGIVRVADLHDRHLLGKTWKIFREGYNRK
jgi:hypothetical protein